jgi:hypothetical protein
MFLHSSASFRNRRRGSGSAQCRYQEKRGVSSRSSASIGGRTIESSGYMSYHFCVT